MILTLNPGGYDSDFDESNYKKGDFSVQDYHSYLNPKKKTNRMAPAIQDFFENQKLLANSIPIPILFFRSNNIKQWIQEFSKLNSEESRNKVEQFCYEKVKKIIHKVRPRKILIVSFQTLDKIIENSIIPLEMEKTEYSWYGNKKQRIYSLGKWDNKPVFCIRHLTRAIPKVQDMIKMKQEFARFLRK